MIRESVLKAGFPTDNLVCMATPERENHRTTLEFVVSGAKETLLREGIHTPTLIVEGSSNLITGKLPDMPEKHGAKREYMRSLGQLTAKNGRVGELRQIFFVSEGWICATNEEASGNVLPSQDPNRKEVLIVCNMQIQENHKYLKMFEILRDNESRIVGFSGSITDSIQDVSFDTPLEDAFVSGFLDENNPNY